PGCDRRVQADSREVVREILDVLDPGAADERGRAHRGDADAVLDEALPRLALGDEDLDGELLDAARQHRDGLDLGVVDLDDLAGEGARPRGPERYALEH